MTRSRSRRVQKMLEDELEELKRLLGMGYELNVVWLPNGSSGLSGEVRNETILVYEEEPKEALETLLHEFLDYAVSKVIEPYRDLLNQIIRMVNLQAYKRKELVESLRRLIEQHIPYKNQKLDR